jgi:hypothetical protein
MGCSLKISDIKIPNKSELKDFKLKQFKSDADLVKAINHDKDPIVLYQGSRPYEICDGRHRVYLAKQKGINVIPVLFN